ncbi:hypothetical protein BRD06_12370, partial [Halobacteriales archaeon QS_9_67_15]
AVGPIQSNRTSAAGTGIVVSGFTNRLVEGNELSDIDGTAVSVEGGVATLGGAGYLLVKRLGTDESADED